MNLATKLRRSHDELVAGWRVVGELAWSATHGEPRVTWPSPSGAFYPLGWWWEGEHILVPQLIEEERIAAELERTFAANEWTWGDGITVNTRGSLGIGTVAPGTFFTVSSSSASPSLLVQDNDSSSLVVNPPSGQVVGHWRWESVKIGIVAHPSPLRRWILKTLLGMTYSPTTSQSKSAPTTKSSPTPLSVLAGYLDSVPTLPTPTNSGSSDSTTTSPTTSVATRSS